MAQHDLAYNLTALNWRDTTGTDNDYRLVKDGNTFSWKRKNDLGNGDLVIGSFDDFTTEVFNRGISIPSGTTYTSIATWNGASYPGGSNTTVFAYVNASLGLHYSCNVATSGTAPMTQPPAGTYRIRVSGGGSSAAQTGLIGTISAFVAQDGATNQCTIRIGSSSQWGAAFGSVPATGVVWHLERQTITPPLPTIPDGAAAWNAGSGAATMTAIYQANGVLAVNDTELVGNFSGTVPANTIWRIRRLDNSAMTAFGVLTSVQGAGFKTIRVGTLAEMVTAFGSSQITTGSGWVLEQGTEADVPILAVGTWNAGNGFFARNANYQASGILHVNNTAATGNWNGMNVAGYQYRIRRADNSATTGFSNLYGSNAQFSRELRIGTSITTAAANMQSAFGSGDITHGPDWVLERRVHVNPPAPPPVQAVWNMGHKGVAGNGEWDDADMSSAFVGSWNVGRLNDNNVEPGAMNGWFDVQIPGAAGGNIGTIILSKTPKSGVTPLTHPTGIHTLLLPAAVANQVPYDLTGNVTSFSTSSSSTHVSMQLVSGQLMADAFGSYDITVAPGREWILEMDTVGLSRHGFAWESLFSGSLPTDTSGNWRLELTGNSNPERNQKVEGALILDTTNKSLVVGDIFVMRIHWGFGKDLTHGGGRWTLSRL